MLFGHFLRDRKASAVPLLALAIIPLLGAVGAAVDYTRAASVRSAMQNAIDAAGLMVAKEVQSQNLNSTQVNTRGNNYFNSLFSRPEASNVQVTASVTPSGTGLYTMHIAASATITTAFWRVLGAPQVNITASNDVVWGIRKLNLALALDNTGSMAQSGKMTALKTAAHNLLTTLQNAAQNDGDVKVSIVPFATDVNVGTAVSGTYIDWTQWDQDNGSWSQQCSGSGWNQNCTWVWNAASHSNWNGCVWDRDQNNDTTDTPPVAGSSSTMFPAHQASNCPTRMMALTSDWTSLSNKIDAMNPTGNTNVTIGLDWAYLTLSQDAPFSAPAPAPDLDKVIILLTDGDNTQNRWTSSSSSIDSRTERACTNIKAENIKLYTVRVIDGNSTLLRNCATNPSMYYEVSQASQLNTVFTTIAQNLANLRIAR